VPCIALAGDVEVVGLVLREPLEPVEQEFVSVVSCIIRNMTVSKFRYGWRPESSKNKEMFVLEKIITEIDRDLYITYR
jgi:hypothetical protein